MRHGEGRDSEKEIQTDRPRSTERERDERQIHVISCGADLQWS
mgnify:CR=1 FL=1